MAKKLDKVGGKAVNETTAPATRVEYDKNKEFGFTLSAESLGLMADESKIAPKGLAYLLKNGLKQSLDDSIAGLAANIAGKSSVAKANWDDKDRDAAAKELGLVDKDETPSYTIEGLTAAVIADRQAERWKDIVEGEIESRAGGRRLTPEERETRAVSLMFFTAAIAAMNVRRKADGKAEVKLPDGADLTAALEKYAAAPANKEKIEGEVKRRLSLSSSTDEFDESLLPTA